MQEKEKKRRPGFRALYVELPLDLSAELDALAERNMRTVKAEVVLALRAHLAAGRPAPDVPPTPPAVPQAGPPAEGTAGRAKGQSKGRKGTRKGGG